MAHDKAVQERDALASCNEGNAYVEKLKSEHRQYVEENETRFKAAAEAMEQARSTAAEDASKVIDLEFKREELTNSLAIAQTKIRSLLSEMEAAKKQNDFDSEYQEQKIGELRKDSAMLKGEMDELRQVAHALSTNKEAERKEAERKEAERKAQVESPVKPGPHHPEPPPPDARTDTFPIGQPRSLGPLRTEGSIPATVDGSPPDVGGIPVKTAMDANATKRNTGFFNVIWNRGGCNRASYSFNALRSLVRRILGQTIGRSRNSTNSAMTLCSKAPLTRMPNKTKMAAKMKGRRLRYVLPKNKT